MKSKSILLVLLTFASVPAKADIFTAILFDTGARLVGSAVKGVGSAVKNAVISKESAGEKAAREKSEIEYSVDQVLDQYPEDQREEMRPKIVQRLAIADAQYKSVEARQEAVRAEQNSVGNVLFNATVGAASSAIGNHMSIDAAARAASIRARF